MSFDVRAHARLRIARMLAGAAIFFAGSAALAQAPSSPGAAQPAVTNPPATPPAPPRPPPPPPVKKRVLYVEESTGPRLANVLVRLHESIPKDVVLLESGNVKKALAKKRIGSLRTALAKPDQQALLFKELRAQGKAAGADAVVIAVVVGGPDMMRVRVIVLSVTEPGAPIVDERMNVIPDGDQHEVVETIGPLLAQAVGTKPPDPEPEPTPAAPDPNPAAGTAPLGTPVPDPLAKPAGEGATKPKSEGLKVRHGGKKGTSGAGVAFATEDGSFSWAFRARFQIRDTYQYWYETAAGSAKARNTFAVERLRFSFGGNAFGPDIQYYGQFGFGNGDEDQAPSPLLDAWVDFRQIRDLNLMVGTINHRFYVFSSANSNLVERSVVGTELFVIRDIGLQLHSENLFGADRFKYWLAVGGGEGLAIPRVEQPTEPGPSRNRIPIGLIYSARVQVQPLGLFDADVMADLERRSSPKISFSVGGFYNHRAMFDQSNRGAQLLSPFNFWHGNADIHFKWLGFSLFAEAQYRRATEASHLVANPDPTLPAITEYARNSWGTYVQAGQMLTSKIGVATRLGTLNSLTFAPGNRDLREVGGGLSYYIDGHALKVQGEFFRVLNGEWKGGVQEARVQLTFQP